MPTIETIHAALSPLLLPHGEGVFRGSPDVDHYVVVPDYDEGYEADNDDLFTDEYMNIEFYTGGDYRTAAKLAKGYLKAAGLSIVKGKYVEFDEETNKHHYYLSVIGREMEE